MVDLAFRPCNSYAYPFFDKSCVCERIEPLSIINTFENLHASPAALPLQLFVIHRDGVRLAGGLLH